MDKRLLKPLMFLAIASPLAILVPAARSASTNIVISEVQTRGDNGASDEFVELYNTSESSIDISGWSLARMGAGSDNETTFIAPIEAGTVPAKGYYLIARSSASTPGYNGTVVPELTYGSSLADNTTILLYDNSDPKQLIDKVGLGENTNPEGSPAPQLIVEEFPVDRSIERVGPDSDDNSVDFVLRLIPNPQNSGSHSVSPSPTPTGTPSPTATADPTGTPVTTATPTITPTASPTATATSTPTLTPSSTPTISPTLQPAPRILALWSFPFSKRVCILKYEIHRFGFVRLLLPRLSCS